MKRIKAIILGIVFIGGLSSAYAVDLPYQHFDQAIKAEQLKKLTPPQYQVTQANGTEQAYKNAYWNNHQSGIYVDVVSGEPLFSSTDKYDSNTGWPSFMKPINADAVTLKEDRTWLFIVRTEVRSKIADSHLGHVFDDGPPPTGKRYCMNSAALRFIPVDEMAQEGYGQYLYLFNKAWPEVSTHNF